MVKPEKVSGFSSWKGWCNNYWLFTKLYNFLFQYITSLAISAYAGLRGGVGLSLVKSQRPFLFGLWGAELNAVKSVATECDVDTERNLEPSLEDFI